MPPRVQLKYLRRQLVMALINSEMPRPLRQFVTDGLPIVYEGNQSAGQFASDFDLISIVRLTNCPNKMAWGASMVKWPFFS